LRLLPHACEASIESHGDCDVNVDVKCIEPRTYLFKRRFERTTRTNEVVHEDERSNVSLARAGYCIIRWQDVVVLDAIYTTVDPRHLGPTLTGATEITHQDVTPEKGGRISTN